MTDRQKLPFFYGSYPLYVVVMKLLDCDYYKVRDLFEHKQVSYADQKRHNPVDPDDVVPTKRIAHRGLIISGEKHLFSDDLGDSYGEKQMEQHKNESMGAMCALLRQKFGYTLDKYVTMTGLSIRIVSETEAGIRAADGSYMAKLLEMRVPAAKGIVPNTKYEQDDDVVLTRQPEKAPKTGYDHS